MLIHRGREVPCFEVFTRQLSRFVLTSPNGMILHFKEAEQGEQVNEFPEQADFVFKDCFSSAALLPDAR